jgi:hypothetical protein
VDKFAQTTKASARRATSTPITAQTHPKRMTGQRLALVADLALARRQAATH